MTPDRREELNQRFREKHLLDAMEDLGNAIESLTEEDENHDLWIAVGACRDMIRGRLQTFCKHDWIPESAANGWRSKCRKCWLEAAGSCQG